MEHLNRPHGRHRQVSQVVSPPNERRGISVGGIFKKLAFGVAPRLGATLAAPLTGGASLAALPAIDALEGGGGSNLGNILQAGTGALGTIQGARQQGEANELQRRAIAQAEADFAARQPFRDRLTASFDNPAQRQDLGDIFGTENPFSRSLAPIGQAPVGPAPQQQLGPISLPPGFRTIDERATTNRERNRGRDLNRPGGRREERF